MLTVAKSGIGPQISLANLPPHPSVACLCNVYLSGRPGLTMPNSEGRLSRETALTLTFHSRQSSGQLPHLRLQYFSVWLTVYRLDCQSIIPLTVSPCLFSWCRLFISTTHLLQHSSRAFHWLIACILLRAILLYHYPLLSVFNCLFVYLPSSEVCPFLIFRSAISKQEHLWSFSSLWYSFLVFSCINFDIQTFVFRFFSLTVNLCDTSSIQIQVTWLLEFGGHSWDKFRLIHLLYSTPTGKNMVCYRAQPEFKLNKLNG